MNEPPIVDFEICPGFAALASQMAAVGRSRRSRENTRTRKRLGKAMRKALEPITKPKRRLICTWSIPDIVDLRGTPLTAESFRAVADNAAQDFALTQEERGRL